MSGMFGCVVSGRLVQTDALQVSPTQFIFNLTDTDNIHHVVVFMTGVTPFPDGMGGAVYFCYPSPTGPIWQLLGFISNNKPSAIFKISRVQPENAVQNPFSMNPVSVQAQIGISVESLGDLSQQTPVAGAMPSTLNAFVEFTQKMLEDFVNFASSFAITQAQMTPNPTASFVPMNFVQQWYNKFQRKMANDPHFWKH